ncbi:uncharacterized protein F5Z01DRAFT_315994 [Emericellopsis atlantica]|uniref:DUF7730 domain-containing protein n=1 Tax=Emericellopsis atlantica TaxID=2614577 RepID=A0A9P8CT54_9HYPO|nr:uncharacterized protein F5Z01DRAFT_315994 [Emericellopsis atlantica]KAG9258057.1 hypothetical protein F5Z01DRAFT_315994 [Emericellopsis atlantica]
METFGNRTMHMDLTLDHPMAAPRQQAHGDRSSRRQIRLPRVWEWGSSDCHRNAPWLKDYPKDFWRQNTPLDVDWCMKGQGRICGVWFGEKPYKCRIGAMDWLLSCRQAYEEGIHILYGTNTFFLSSDFLLAHLADYILPQRLAQMTSFEVILDLPLYKSHQSLFRPSSAALVSVLRGLSKTGMRQLYLCLHDHCLWGSLLEIDPVHILDTIDTFILSSRMESVVLEIQPHALKRLEAEAVSLPEETSRNAQPRTTYPRLWRCLDDDQGLARTQRRKCLYPLVPAPP